MSIPRIAIERPVTMFMMSAVIVLLGAISLFRLPVDLMPDVTYPSITVRVGYGGVGPAEIEELIVRPLEQSLAAVPGLEQINSTASGRLRQRAAELRVGHRTSTKRPTKCARASIACAAGCRRKPIRRPSQKFDSSAPPIMSIGVEGDFDRVTLREMAENDLVPRFERVEGVAAVTVKRRPAPADSHRAVEGKDHGARPLGRSRRPADPLREPERPARRGRRGRHDLPAPQPGPVPEPRSDPRPRRADQGRRAGLPARHRRGQGHDRGPAVVPAHQRQARRAPAGHEAVGQEHGRDRATAVTRRDRAHQPRGADRPPDAARRPVEVHRAVDRRRDGSASTSARSWSSAIIFIFLRDLRSTFIICTVDSDLDRRHVRAALLRRLHAEHDDVRRPGARRRHDCRRLDRRAREHVPAHGEGQVAHAGGDRRQRRSLVGHSRVDAHAHRGVRAAALPDRRLEHPVRPALDRRHVLADRCRCSSRSRSCRCSARAC